MISFTVLGTTTHPEQKQKTIVTMEYAIPATVVNVASLKAVSYDIASFRKTISETKLFYFNHEPLLINPLDDVGWFSEKLSINKIHYKEKLNKDYKLIADKVTYNCRSNC
jgi:hypothetical protein